MATCEEGPKGRAFIWDLQDGKRLAVLQPHAESIHTLCFSPESNLLCTSGWDHVRREQIVVWNIAVCLQLILN
jgi:WD40 repeat protein